MASAAPHVMAGRRALAVLALVRWPNALISALGVVAGAWWARGVDIVVPSLPWAMAAAMLATAVVNAVNDIADVDIDRVAHPERPLPSGLLSLRLASVVGGVAALGALVCADLAGGIVRPIVMGALLVGVGYSPLFKSRGLPGNIVVAVAASFPFLVGAEAVAKAGDALALFAVAVPLHFAREVMKDLADVAGDRGRRRTLALRSGPRVARVVAVGAVLAYAAVATFLFARAGPWRLALVPSAALAAWACLRAAEHRAPALLKLSMLLAMAALPLLR